MYGVPMDVTFHGGSNDTIGGQGRLRCRTRSGSRILGQCGFETLDKTYLYLSSTRQGSFHKLKQKINHLSREALRCQANNSAGHLDLGWAEFTTAAVKSLQEVLGSKLVAILWGQRAMELAAVLSQATIISSPHPSPLSSYRGFFGSRPFSRCNNALVELGLSPIDWSA